MEAQNLIFMNCSGRNMELTLFWADRRSKSTNSFEVKKLGLFPSKCNFAPSIDLSNYGIAPGSEVQLQVSINLVSNPIFSQSFTYQDNDKTVWYKTIGRTGSHIKVQGPFDKQPKNKGGKN